MKGGNRVASTDPFPVDGLPSRPKDLGSVENRYWTMLINQIPERLLRQIDCHQLANLVALLAMRDRLLSAIKTDPGDLKAGRLFLQTVQAVGRQSSLYGLSPTDRQRLRLPYEPEEEDDPFEELLARLSS